MSTRELTSYRNEALRASRYGEGALGNACEVIRSAPTGARNATLFAQSAGIFQLVAGGVIASRSAEQALTDVAIETGLKPKEIREVLKSARARGMQSPRKPPERIGFDAIRRRSLPPKPLPRRLARTEPNYPPRDQVEWLWRRGMDVASDDGVSAWLLGRDLDPDRISRFRLARALPTGLRWPGVVPKAQGFGQWRSGPDWGLRMLIPLYDLKGVIRSVVFRRAFDMRTDHPRLAEAPPKVLHARGGRAGLVMANAVARAILLEGGMPELFRGATLEVVVAEGEMDLLAASIEPHGRDTIRAVFGICSGSWRSDHARLIPAGSRVAIATDQDEQGERYAEHVEATFASRQVAVGRWRPHQEGQDLCDARGLRGGRVDWDGAR